MEKELENFIVKSDEELDYFDDIIEHITENEKRILNFFKLEKLPQKVEIEIMRYEPFKENYLENHDEIPDYLCGNSSYETKKIRLVNIEDRIKYTNHKNTNIDSFKKTVLHEIVHQCHSVHDNDCNQTKWFRDGLACNLADQRYKPLDINKCDFEKLKKDYEHCNGNYAYSYAIVKYVLSHYPVDEVTKLYSDSNYLRERADSIFEEAKAWINERSKNDNSENER